jgi:hypothetical protein
MAIEKVTLHFIFNYLEDLAYTYKHLADHLERQGKKLCIDASELSDLLYKAAHTLDDALSALETFART